MWVVILHYVVAVNLLLTLIEHPTASLTPDCLCPYPAVVCWASVHLSACQWPSFQSLHVRSFFCPVFHLTSFFSIFPFVPSVSLFILVSCFTQSLMVRVPAPACPWAPIPHFTSLNLSRCYFYAVWLPPCSLVWLYVDTPNQLSLLFLCFCSFFLLFSSSTPSRLHCR